MTDDRLLQEILTGLNEMREALVFLHKTAKRRVYMQANDGRRLLICRSHNNVSPSSVFVCEEGGAWQLGSLECCRPLAHGQHWVADAFVARMHDAAFRPPEDLVRLS